MTAIAVRTADVDTADDDVLRRKSRRQALLKHEKRSSPASTAPPKLLFALPFAVLFAGLTVIRISRADTATRAVVRHDNHAASLSKRWVQSYSPEVAVNPVSARYNTSKHSHDDIGHNGTTLVELPSYVPYHKLYQKVGPGVGVTLLIAWLTFLFSFLGIVASDFFCPNLSTLASRLGLPEDVAGATMVGWANGAPDLFSTFASLKAGSGSLAIGELLGAASFICSVVAGCMVLVKPFRVHRWNFFRDVGFFTIAVAFSLMILRDGRIRAWEARSMCGLYVCYVALVTGGSWWRRRRWRRKERERLAREAWNESSEPLQNPYDEDVDARTRAKMSERGLPSRLSTSSLSPLVIPVVRVQHTQTGEDVTTDDREDYFGTTRSHRYASDDGDAENGRQTWNDATTPMTGLPSPFIATSAVASTGRKRAATTASPQTALHRGISHSRGLSTTTSITPFGHGRAVSQHILPPASRVLHRSSILGAIEFRDVVNSLQADAKAARAFEPFNGLPTPSELRSGHSRSGSRAKSLGGKSTRRPQAGRFESSASIGSGAHTPSARSDSGSLDDDAQPISASTPDVSRKSGQSRLALPELNDPWKNAPAPLSRSGTATPPISISEQQAHEQHTREYRAWGGQVPPGLCALDDAENAEDEDGNNESGVTERPMTSVNASHDSNERSSVLQRIPSKAKQLLGLNGTQQAGQSDVAPKAQRVLGLAADDSAAVPRSHIKFDWRYTLAVIREMIYAVFPSLHGFFRKSILAMITSLISVPAVLLLNLTLPVVDESETEAEYLEELEKEHIEDSDGQIRLEEEDDNDDGRGIIDLISHSHHLATAPTGQMHAQAGATSEEIENIIHAEEAHQHDANVQRALAIAEELHSPVATHHRYHFISDPTPFSVTDGRLAPPEHRATDPATSQNDDSPIVVASTLHQSPVTMPIDGPGAIPTLPALDDEQDLMVGGRTKVDDADLTRYLTAVQCFLAPLFIVFALFAESLQIWYIPTAFVIGTSLATIVVLFFKDEMRATRVLSLCCIGFVVAIVWILTIVNEVVGVLQVNLTGVSAEAIANGIRSQTIGHIFGLSDAILGLTIFAMVRSHQRRRTDLAYPQFIRRGIL